MESFCLIHIGKCGGLSLSTALSKNNIDFEGIHVDGYGDNFDFKNKKYVILIRNPIERYISSFNFTFERIDSWGGGEHIKNMLGKYKTLNRMAKELYVNEELNEEVKREMYILPHLEWDIAKYLRPILEQCNKDNIIKVITTNDLKKEAKKLFGVRVKKRNASKPKQEGALLLCEESHNNLKRFLKEDYDCIQTLYDWGCIEHDKFTNLMK
jgi:hypothetical protein